MQDVNLQFQCEFSEVPTATSPALKRDYCAKKITANTARCRSYFRRTTYPAVASDPRSEINTTVI